MHQIYINRHETQLNDHYTESAIFMCHFTYFETVYTDIYIVIILYLILSLYGEKIM